MSPVVAAAPAETPPAVAPDDSGPYDRRRLSYAGTFPDPWQAGTIRAVEWMTGKLTLLRHIRAFEASGVPDGQAFWPKALAQMGIEVRTPLAEVAHIPPTGPLVVVANHPHGLVDGMVLADLLGRVRTDYRILTRSLLTGVPEVDRFMIPVPFPHEAEAHERNLDMRARAMTQLAQGGAVALFPSGRVAASDSLFGPAVEAEWNVFTAKMILRSGAAVLPVRFTGQNSRAYQIANRLSATLRQGLLLHEIKAALHRPQAPVIGKPIPAAELASWRADPRGFMAWLRAHVLALERGA
ncbi:lysophospholipid acyltransferase family protein [Frigidibacter oleivorans]|uniref:lysophospholipid acyltransferase family protein n=1 Tax=Frigidibacter oleivorans TaxID=2487129 RepID=UPI000F8F2FCF|nr:lysophospholipid acyltransferase family protein [Frigidibacter oleivorans]